MVEIHLVEDWCRLFAAPDEKVYCGRAKLSKEDIEFNAEAMKHNQTRTWKHNLDGSWGYDKEYISLRNGETIIKSGFHFGSIQPDRKLINGHLKDIADYYLVIPGMEGIVGFFINNNKMAFFYFNQYGTLAYSSHQLSRIEGNRWSATLVERQQHIKGYQSKAEQEYTSERAQLFMLANSLAKGGI